jgi:hypothetical protein
MNKAYPMYYDGSVPLNPANIMSKATDKSDASQILKMDGTVRRLMSGNPYVNTNKK